MAKLSTCLLALALAVVLDASLAGFVGGYKTWDRFDGNHVAFASGKCSALSGILPTPQSGCCGKHATEDNNDGDQNNNNDGTDDNEENNEVDDENEDSNGDHNEIDDGSEDSDDDHNEVDDGDEIEDYNEDTDNSDEDYGLGDLWNRWINRFRVKRSAEQNASDIAPDKFITAGKPTGLNQYPWLVHLIIKISNLFQTGAIACGGSLISPRFVLTAAHCVNVNYRSYDDITIVMAEYDTRTFPRDCVGKTCVKNVAMHPEEIIMHERYVRERLYNDIALLRLRGSAPYSEHIRPICLPPFNIDSQKNEGAPLAITGWGSTGRVASPIKLGAEVQLVPHRQCKRYYGDLIPGQICAAGRRGQDTCQGDSGGPLMVEHKGNFYVVGIVSGKSSETHCGSSFPTLYTNVFAYTNWIKQKMGRH